MPLPEYENRSLDTEREIHRFKGGGMPILHEIPDEFLVFAGIVTTAPFSVVRHAGRAHDRKVRSHVIDQSDVAVIEDGYLIHDLIPKKRGRRDDRPIPSFTLRPNSLHGSFDLPSIRSPRIARR